MTVCLYEKDAYSPKPDEKAKSDEQDDLLDPRIWTALEVIAREGDRLGGHGFALLWKDHLGISLTGYNLTVCGVSPFAFFQASRMRGNIGSEDGWLVGKLDQYVRDHDPAGHSEFLWLQRLPHSLCYGRFRTRFSKVLVIGKPIGTLSAVAPNPCFVNFGACSEIMRAPMS